jgi:hypothetical protein
VARYFVNLSKTGTFDTKDLPSDAELEAIELELRAVGDKLAEMGFDTASAACRRLYRKMRNPVERRVAMAEFLGIIRLHNCPNQVVEISPEAIKPTPEDRAPDDPENIPYGEAVAD